MIASMNGNQKIAARITDDRPRIGVGVQVFNVVSLKLRLGCRFCEEVKENPATISTTDVDPPQLHTARRTPS
jgi:hypothetical protein